MNRKANQATPAMRAETIRLSMAGAKQESRQESQPAKLDPAVRDQVYQALFKRIALQAILDCIGPSPWRARWAKNYLLSESGQAMAAAAGFDPAEIVAWCKKGCPNAQPIENDKRRRINRESPDLIGKLREGSENG